VGRDIHYVQALAKLLRTSTFRLVAAYLVLFAVSVGAILAYVYWNTAVLLERQINDTIEAEVTGLAEQYSDGGLDRLLRTVQDRSEDADNSLYLISNKFGRRLAGNMVGTPQEVEGVSGWAEFPYTVRTAEGAEYHRARAFHINLEGDFKLIVGRDIEERLQFASIIRQTLFWALGLTVALGLAGGFFISRSFLNRIDSISQTGRRIMAGNLSERMPVTGTGDELDRLAGNLNQMLDQIERLMTGMKQVTDNVAHDLRTPLTRLRARAEDALRSNSKETYRAALERTIGEADILLKTFSAMLSIARSEAGEARSGFGTVDLAELAQELGELYGPEIEDAGGAFEVSAPDSALAHADRQLVAQALSNLLDNALKYAQPGADDAPPLAVTVDVSRMDDRIALRVSDNGPGIAAGDRERAVERFVRLDDSRSEPGSGLGLSLADAVAKLHGGRLVLGDNGPGLTVTLEIPVGTPE
jgi:signal transduction histidine kinase